MFLLFILFFILFLSFFIYFIVINNNNINNIEQRLTLNANQTETVYLNIKDYENFLLNIIPESGSVLCDLKYGKDIILTQCKWYSESSTPNTNIFANNVISNYYKLDLLSPTDTVVNLSIKQIETESITPYNAIQAPIDVKHTRFIEIVPLDSTYAIGESSTVYDFGLMNGTNIEIQTKISNSTSQCKLNIFGSDENTASKFIRLAELVFEDGTYDNINSYYYIDRIIETHNRYFYIQITNAQANNFYCKIIRRNY